MSRWFLGSCLVLAGLVEAVLWGVRSGPGWLIMVAVAFALSQLLRWRLVGGSSPLSERAGAGLLLYGGPAQAGGGVDHHHADQLGVGL